MTLYHKIAPIFTLVLTQVNIRPLSTQAFREPVASLILGIDALPQVVHREVQITAHSFAAHQKVVVRLTGRYGTPTSS
jgi:hypothetical protein